MTLLAPSTDRASALNTPLQMFIGGQWVDAASGETFASIDPFTGQAWAPLQTRMIPQSRRSVDP